jgi:hypothetical protein
MRAGDFTPEQVERFWAKVDTSGGPDACWPWMGARSRHGYGAFWITPRKQVRASRMAYALQNGELPDELNALHTCDNPPCCNGRHLKAGTQAENIADRNAKGRYDHGPNAPRWTPPPRTGLACGERAARARLTEDAVRAIRAAYAAGGVTQEELAQRFGVSDSAIYYVVKRMSWAHVE